MFLSSKQKLTLVLKHGCHIFIKCDEGGTALNIREGLIPTVLGTAVSATGYALKQNRKVSSMVSNTVFGFGLAHVVLGVIDLVEHRR